MNIPKHALKINHCIARCLASAVAVLMLHSPALADNDAASANIIGTDPDTYQTSNFVGASDTSDNYRFTISSKRSVEIQLTGLSGDADLYLMGDNGLYLMSTNRGSGKSESIARNLDPGGYRLLVYGWQGTVNYDLSVRTWLPNPGNSVTRTLPAIDGMNGQNKTVIAAGSISPDTSYIDYYFTLPGRRLISIRGNGAVSAAVTPDTKPVNWAVLKNNRVDNLRLKAGRHFLRVFRNPKSTEQFSFSISANVYNTRDSAGHTRATARNLGRVGNPPTKIKEFVGQDDYDDYYRVQIAPNTQLNVALTHTSGQGANLRVIDTLGQVIAQSNKPGNQSENVRLNLAVAGVYYVHVSNTNRSGRIEADARYTMLIGTVPAAAGSSPVPAQNSDASESFNSPTLLADVGQIPGSGGKSLTDGESVGGPNDRSDIFAFSIGCNRGREAPSFAINSPNASNVQIQLFENVNGRPVARSFGYGSIVKTAYRGRANYRYFLLVTSPNGALVSYSVTVGHLGCLPA